MQFQRGKMEQRKCDITGKTITSKVISHLRTGMVMSEETLWEILKVKVRDGPGFWGKHAKLGSVSPLKGRSR